MGNVVDTKKTSKSGDESPFGLINEKAFARVIRYLDIKDYVNLTSLNTRFVKTFGLNNYYWAHVCQRVTEPSNNAPAKIPLSLPKLIAKVYPGKKLTINGKPLHEYDFLNVTDKNVAKNFNFKEVIIKYFLRFVHFPKLEVQCEIFSKKTNALLIIQVAEYTEKWEKLWSRRDPKTHKCATDYCYIVDFQVDPQRLELLKPENRGRRLPEEIGGRLVLYAISNVQPKEDKFKSPLDLYESFMRKEDPSQQSTAGAQRKSSADESEVNILLSPRAVTEPKLIEISSPKQPNSPKIGSRLTLEPSTGLKKDVTSPLRNNRAWSASRPSKKSISSVTLGTQILSSSAGTTTSLIQLRITGRAENSPNKSDAEPSGESGVKAAALEPQVTIKYVDPEPQVTESEIQPEHIAVHEPEPVQSPDPSALPVEQQDWEISPPTPQVNDVVQPSVTENSSFFEQQNGNPSDEARNSNEISPLSSTPHQRVDFSNSEISLGNISATSAVESYNDNKAVSTRLSPAPRPTVRPVSAESRVGGSAGRSSSVSDMPQFKRYTGEGGGALPKQPPRHSTGKMSFGVRSNVSPKMGVRPLPAEQYSSVATNQSTTHVTALDTVSNQTVVESDATARQDLPVQNFRPSGTRPTPPQHSSPRSSATQPPQPQPQVAEQTPPRTLPQQAPVPPPRTSADGTIQARPLTQQPQPVTPQGTPPRGLSPQSQPPQSPSTVLGQNRPLVQPQQPKVAVQVSPQPTTQSQQPSIPEPGPQPDDGAQEMFETFRPVPPKPWKAINARKADNSL